MYIWAIVSYQHVLKAPITNPTVPILPRILLAEDAVSAMNLARVLFDDPDLQIDVVTDGRRALERLNQAPKAFDLVILGYDVPGVSAPKCVAFIKQMFRRLPILVLTESLEENQLSELTELGIQQDRVLEKPIEPEAFAARVKGVLSEGNRFRPP